MSPELIGVIGLLIVFVLMAMRMPIGIILAAVGYVGSCSLIGLKAGTAILGISPFDTAFSYTFSVIPLFILMAEFCIISGLGKETFKAVQSWLGHLPGGLAIATIGACAGFGAVCGSSLAGAATLGKLALPEMQRYNYSPKLATGSVAAGGTLSIMIPPSLAFVFYAIITEQSVGKLFIAGILPGLLITGLFMLAIYINTKRNPNLGPSAPKVSWTERFKASKDSWPVVLLFLTVTGGIWVGFFTPTEAAGIGVLVALFLVAMKKRLTGQTVIGALKDMARTTGMMFLIVFGAMIFCYFMGLSRLPLALSEFVTHLGISRYGVLVVIIIIYLLLGCTMDTLTMQLLTLPIITPTAFALGFDPIWFGVIITILVEIAQITPPIGINVFIIAGLAKDVPMHIIFQGIFPFFAALMIALIILIFFPQIALFLPSFMR